ncbi:hypothetical protein [Demequina pelophila]|uniref:hypothetical protein n=1 Tax=Demequina pelophila TaxID=1638984 RepID=UPI0007850EC3|nr:hypothetical protein [Demequina pelophila]
MSGDGRPPVRPVPFAAGMLLGALIGFIIWIATDNFALFPAFLGVGVGLGLAFSQAGGGPRA